MTSVTVVVPAYNEGLALSANLVAISDYFAIHSATFDFRYLIVDDGSTDETFAVAQTFARFRRNVTVVSHDRNYGLGRAIRTAIEHADGEYTIVLDADLSYSPNLAMTLLEELDRSGADIALASAYMRGGRVANVPFMRRVLSREANRLLSLAAGGRYATLTCMVRAYRTAILKALELREDGMQGSAEILLAALRKNAKVVELPAELKWSAERRDTRGTPHIEKIARQTWATLRMAFSYRPSLWLAVPGLFPGLLPLVVGILLLMHVSASTLAIGTAATVAVQYTSLAIFAGQLGTFFTRALIHSRNGAVQKAFHL